MKAKLDSYRKMTVPLIIILGFTLLVSACSSPTTAAPKVPPTAAQEASTATALVQPSVTPVVPTPTPTVAQPIDTATPVPPTFTPTVTETPLPSIGSTRVSEIDQMVQLFVPAGEFLMGAARSDTSARVDSKPEGGRAYTEIPQHTVYLDDYWIDQYEVTNAQYMLCVNAGVCEPPLDFGDNFIPNYFTDPTYASYPVVAVSWFQARTYCEWAGRRLVTEAEWEKASRGTEGQMYPWGEEKPDGTLANFCDVNCSRSIANPAINDGYAKTAPVGSYPAGASPYGAMDMSGNVWEWVSTLIMDYPYDATDGREDLEAPGERAWRGGPWSNGFWWMRSSVRYRSVNFYHWYNLGLRCGSSE